MKEKSERSSVEEEVRKVFDRCRSLEEIRLLEFGRWRSSTAERRIFDRSSFMIISYIRLSIRLNVDENKIIPNSIGGWVATEVEMPIEHGASCQIEMLIIYGKASF